MRVRLAAASLLVAIPFLVAAHAARAETYGDCEPVGTLDNFVATNEPTIRSYNAMDFRVTENGQDKTVTKEGKTCSQTYSLKQGAPASSDLEIIRNYAEGLPTLGLKITNTGRKDDEEVFATGTINGVETWVHVWPSNANTASVQVLQVQPFKAALAPLTGQDCAPIQGLLNFTASDAPQTRVYNTLDFRVVENGAGKTVTQNGETCYQNYSQNAGVTHTTDLEIMRNFAQALPAAGLTITNTDRAADAEIFATGTKDGVETWVHVWPSNGNDFAVQVLRIAAFKPTIGQVSSVDCPPVPGLTDFTASDKLLTHTYDSLDFRVIENGAGKTVTRRGAFCRQNYALKDGVPHKTDLEIIKNFALALPASGFAITNADRADDGEIFATRTRDGTETWVHVWPSNGTSFAVQVLDVAPFKSTIAPPGPNDCPPVPGLLNFTAQGAPQTRTYDAMDFRVVDKGSATTVTKKGAVCTQSYALNAGQKSDLEIIQNYAQFLPAAGFAITNAGRADTEEIFATQKKDGVETWLHVWPSNGVDLSVQVLKIEPFHSTLHAAHAAAVPPPAPPPPAPPAQVKITMALAPPAATPETVRPDTGDFPYLPAIPGSTLTAGRFDPKPFYAQPADARQPEMVANNSIVKEYQSPPGAGLMPVVNAYKAALLRAGWTIVSESQSNGVLLTAHYGANGRNIWASLHFTDSAYTITVADATIVQSQLASDLQSQCHLRLTGVLFDFDKSTLKPESNAVLQQVDTLLVNDPALKLEIQGHTDNVGSEAYNQRLSQARARSVVAWLVHGKVAPSRLTAHGYGKTRPVASNDTDAGRAQNRRVEIANPACRS
jgi:outer membrane protein OmpA-like peptidoglycan-associated protein